MGIGVKFKKTTTKFTKKARRSQRIRKRTKEKRQKLGFEILINLSHRL